MSAQGQLVDAPMISAHTADGYRRALAALVKCAQQFLDEDDGDSTPMFRHARQLSTELREHPHQPRVKMTRSEVHRNALRRLMDAIDEFVDLEHHDGVLVSAYDLWDEFRREVRSASRTADSYGPDDTTWAPEDDETNPLKTSPVPEPDPTAEAINGVRQGDYVTGPGVDTPRRVLTGVEDHAVGGPSVRLSDPRDGSYFGGYWVQGKDIGTRYMRAEPPAAASDGAAPADPAALHGKQRGTER